MAKQPKQQAANTNKKNVKKNIPTDVFETIPYRSVYKNGIIEDYDGMFSKTYMIPDVNYETEADEKQGQMVYDYESVINSVDPGCTGQLTIINRNIDVNVIRNNILIKPAQDEYNQYRNELNQFFSEMLSEGHNNMIKEKYWTASVPASNIVEATDTLRRMDKTLTRALTKIAKGTEINSLNIGQRLALMYDIFNPAEQLSFSKKAENFLTADGDIDLPALAKAGLYSKHLISPDSFSFKTASSFMVGEMYARTMYLDHLPSSLSSGILDDLTNIPVNMIASITYTQIPQADAAKMMKNQLQAMNAQINRQQMDAAKEGITNSGAVSTELQNARDAAYEMIQDVAKNDQRIFRVTALFTVFAKTKEELDSYCNSLKSIATGNLCQMRLLAGYQEKAFAMCLPLAKKTLPIDRVMTTESACVFLPFTVMDLNQEDGICYGINPSSLNLIRYNKKKASNYNSAFFGISGSGKSFLIKEEIAQVRLKTDEQIIIIDPQGEYAKMTQALGGTVIKLDNSKGPTATRLNPLDMDVFCAGGEDPIPNKCQEIAALIEVMTGGEGSLGPLELSVIKKVARNMYKQYYIYMRKVHQTNPNISCDKEQMPTLVDFYTDMLKMKEPEAAILARAIEPYCVGDSTMFAERTNVNTDAQIICYDVSSLNGIMKELGMHVCLTDATNRMIARGRQGLWTHLYIDEFHLFTKSKTSSEATRTIYKTIRKFHGMPTIITQNISDMLSNTEAEAILDNCSFIVMMNQSPTDRVILAERYSISDRLMENVTDQSFGHGLIYTGTAIVAFENFFPKDTEMFELMRSQTVNT